MNPIGYLDFRFDPASALAELAQCDDLWDEIRIRTMLPTSPHREVSDIWLRYNDLSKFNGNMAEFNGPHESVWYSCMKRLPALKALCEGFIEHMKGTALGGVLVTKVAAGKQVYPHIDRGWHAGHYRKAGLQLCGNKDQAFCFEKISLSALPGESYHFDNQVLHWVKNDSDEDRITLIVTGSWEGETCQ